MSNTPGGYIENLSPARKEEVRLTRVFSVGCPVYRDPPGGSGALPLTGQRAEDVRR
jgi:hypothetical protein